MTPEQKEAVLALREGLNFHDYYGPRSDDAQIYVSETGSTIYEFASLESKRVLRLGHLRDLLTFFEGIKL